MLHTKCMNQANRLIWAFNGLTLHKSTTQEEAYQNDLNKHIRLHYKLHAHYTVIK